MADTGRSDLWRRLAWLGLALAVVVAYGVIGYMVLEGWGFLDALYMTVTTLATVGFGEVQPLDAGGRLFTLSLIVAGVGIVLITISMAASLFAEGEFWISRRRRRMRRRIDGMRDHYIVCAYGRVGRAVARELEREGTSFVVIDPKEELEERMREDDVVYLIGDPTMEPVLRTAGLSRAKGLVCAVDSDATNVYITLTARGITPGIFIVARASEPGSPDRLRRAGADRVVSPFVSSGRHMAMMALRPHVIDVLEVSSPGRQAIELEELVVEEGSALAGARLGSAQLPADVIVVRRGDGALVPNPPADLKLREGDVLLLLGMDAANQELARSARSPAGRVR